uniref:cytochrome b6/f complex subunit VI n=1 Tax=Pteris ensiformis TaxID=265700 RepID=UPI002A82C630|nr:cytochrome b6/f complex subunit VI [Pteris ensiformis]WNR49123.1 cytochrome b6/f complex subunit VI [Pteris ensiformis]
MLTPLSYFAFLMLALTLTPALFVGLNKIQILQLILIVQEKEKGREDRGLLRTALTNLLHLPMIFLVDA